MEGGRRAKREGFLRAWRWARMRGSTRPEKRKPRATASAKETSPARIAGRGDGSGGPAAPMLMKVVLLVSSDSSTSLRGSTVATKGKEPRVAFQVRDQVVVWPGGRSAGVFHSA